MNPSINGNIALIGLPMDLGVDRRGVDMGPSAIRCAGLEAVLEQIGYRIHDRGESGVITSVDVVEVNLILDMRNQTATTAVALLGSLFGDAIL